MAVLVVCVDRDNDLGRKTKIKGPVVGKDKCLNAAISLAKADPADTDANTMFQAVKVYQDLISKKKNAKVAILTGDEKVGLKSDEEVARQLREVVHGASGVIFVSDGADDEQLIPIIQSYSKIISVERVVVKQAERLESFYYTFIDFVRRVIRDKELSRLILGLPGIAAIIYALLGAAGWRLIVGILGLYLVGKGLHLGERLNPFYEELRISFKKGKPSVFVYAISVLLFGIATASGLNAINNGIIYFIKASDFLYLSAVLAFFLAKALDASNIPSLIDYTSFGAFLTIMVWTFDSALSIMIEGSGFGLTITPIFTGLVLIISVMVIRKLIKRWMRV